MIEEHNYKNDHSRKRQNPFFKLIVITVRKHPKTLGTNCAVKYFNFFTNI